MTIYLIGFISKKNGSEFHHKIILLQIQYFKKMATGDNKTVCNLMHHEQT